MRTLKEPHLALLCAALLAGGLWALWPQSPTPQQSASSVEPSTTTTTDTFTGDPAESPQPPPATPASPEPTKPSPAKKRRQIAAAFASGYPHEKPHRQWLTDLEPLVTEELLEGFHYTDPRLLPKGPPNRVQAALNGGPSFVITYPDQTRVRCTLTPVGSSWKVDSVEPFRTPSDNEEGSGYTGA